MRRSTTRDYLEALLVAVILATFARTYVLQVFKIPSGSMEDTLLVGDHILVNKFIYSGGPEPSRWVPHRDVRRGDVVVFKWPLDPGRDFIKRCVGLPGDRIELADKMLFVNGQAVDESAYAHFTDDRTFPNALFLPDEYRLRDNFGAFTVPEGQLFFLGDNRDSSDDSRFWGTVPVDHLKGRALLVYWSFDSGVEHTEWPGYAGRIRQLGEVAAKFFTHTRWDRSMRVIR